MSILDGFTSFNFNEGAPYVSVTKNGITFNKGTVMKLQYPEYVVLFINPDTKQIAIQACDKDIENAVVFCSAEKRNNKVLSIRWNAKDLLNTVKEITGWDLSQKSYRAEGKLIVDEKAMLFDLSNAEELK